MARKEIHLHNGAKIAVIGAGPAGTFFANFAYHLAKEKGLEVAITIFDGKDFNLVGPPSCNLCAGVISRNLTEIRVSPHHQHRRR